MPEPAGAASADSSPSGEILDAHCHAWRHWPYPPPVPDALGRGTLGQLVYEMDLNGVSEAVIVCAGIEANPDNLGYVTAEVGHHPGRFHVLADLDCPWSTTYHLPGSADRLRALADEYKLVGFTHYLDEDNDGWLAGDEAEALFSLSAERGLVASLAVGPAWQADLRRLALRHPEVAVLCHHLGDLRAGDSDGLAELLASAAVPNIYVKASGFHYASGRAWDAPWADALGLLRRILDAYGPNRLCWGSDFPASKRFCTYRQSLEAVRSHCEFLSPAEIASVLGGTLRSVLAGRRNLPG